MDTTQPILDRNALRFNQIAIITLVLTGFLLNQPIFPAFVAAVLVTGSILPRFALFKVVYRHVLKPLGLMSPQLVNDVPAPHEFAQLLGGIVLGGAVIFLVSGAPVVGWGLSWVVVLLAATNLFFGFCAGCFVYYQLGRIGIPGFRPYEGPTA